MAEARAKLTNAEATLAHALCVLVARPARGEVERDLMFLQILAEAAPACDRAHPWIGPLVEAADDLVEAGIGGDRWTGARWRAGEAVERFSEWRCGLAQAAWRRETGQ